MPQSTVPDVQIKHHITLENRKNLTATGITAIVSYDAFAATLETPFGQLVIGGQDLVVSELSTQLGEIKVTGQIEYLQYSAPKDAGRSLWKRLVR